MTNWNLTDADGRLGMVALEALCSGPQRVTLDGEVDLVVLSPEEYARLTGQPQAQEPADSQTEPGTGASFFAEMRRPFEEAAARGEDVYWPWDWDDETRSWVVPADQPVSSELPDHLIHGPDERLRREVLMKEWELEEARKHLDAIADLAITKGPQRVVNGTKAVVVLDADEYDRIIRGIEPTEPPYDELGEPVGFVEFMRNSPLAEAFREGDFTEEEWDAACRMGR